LADSAITGSSGAAGCSVAGVGSTGVGVASDAAGSEDVSTFGGDGSSGFVAAVVAALDDGDALAAGAAFGAVDLAELAVAGLALASFAVGLAAGAAAFEAGEVLTTAIECLLSGTLLVEVGAGIFDGVAAVFAGTALDDVATIFGVDVDGAFGAVVVAGFAVAGFAAGEAAFAGGFGDETAFVEVVGFEIFEGEAVVVAFFAVAAGAAGFLCL